MKPLCFSPRNFLIAIAIGLVSLAIFGWAFWSLAAVEYRRVVDGWIEDGRRAGYDITYDDRQIFGFPRRITMRLSNLRWRNADGIDFRTDAMDIIALPWNWHDFDAKFKTHATLAAPLDSEGHALILSSDKGRARVHLNEQGVWSFAKLSLTTNKIGLAPQYLFDAERLSVSIERPEIAPKNYHEVGLTIDGEADTIDIPDAMPSPFGPKAAKLSAHMRVMGAVPSIRHRASVDAWNKDSGIVEFDDFSVNWGLLDLASKGTLGFDDDLQPEGAFAGRITNAEKTMQALMDQGFIATHDAGMLSSAMALFAKSASRGSKGQELPITIQLGGLFFGPVRIFTFPEIEWPVEPPPAQ